MTNKLEKHLFICSTPYHLMSIISICIEYINSKDIKSIYILDHSNTYYELYESAKRAKCFDNIFLLKTKEFNNHWTQKYKITRYISKTLEYFFYEKIANHFVYDKNTYTKFWVPFMDRSTWLIFLLYKKYTPNIELNFIEDGLGGYRLLTTKENSLDKTILHLLGHNSIFEEIKKLYVYEPKLAKNTINSKIQIVSIPKINNKSIISILNNTFNFNATDLFLFDSTAIYFDAPFLQQDILDKEIQILTFLHEQLKDSMVIKIHPRSNLKNSYCTMKISNVTTYMELLYANKDSSKNILISGFSTASIMPKLIFDQEPIVIFLYKIFGLDQYTYSSENYIEFIKDFTQTYRNPERIYLPETIEELKIILKEFK